MTPLLALREARFPGHRFKAWKNPRVVWDGSTKYKPLGLVMNKVILNDEEAPVTFVTIKMEFYIWLYNMRVSFPYVDILLAMADVKARFRFSRIHSDLTGAFGFLADIFYCLTTTMVFRSNISASSWEPFRQAIKTIALSRISNFTQFAKLLSNHSKLTFFGQERQRPTMWITPTTNSYQDLIHISTNQQHQPHQVDSIIL